MWRVYNQRIFSRKDCASEYQAVQHIGGTDEQISVQHIRDVSERTSCLPATCGAYVIWPCCVLPLRTLMDVFTHAIGKNLYRNKPPWNFLFYALPPPTSNSMLSASLDGYGFHPSPQASGFVPSADREQISPLSLPPLRGLFVVLCIPASPLSLNPSDACFAGLRPG
jgi:hypothetical protein